MPSRELAIINKLGLHARAAARFVTTASEHPCEIHVTRGERRVNGKSIMGVMMLAAGQGSQIVVEAEGEGAEAALAALEQLVGSRFGEAE